MRKAIFIITGLQVLAVLAMAVMVILNPVDSDGNPATLMVPRIYAQVLVVTLMPAGILAYTERWQWAGLAFALMPLIPLALMLVA